MSQLYWQKYYTNPGKKKKKKMFSAQRGSEDCSNSRLFYLHFAILISVMEDKGGAVKFSKLVRKIPLLLR